MSILLELKAACWMMATCGISYEPESLAQYLTGTGCHSQGLPSHSPVVGAKHPLPTALYSSDSAKIRVG